jgi:hypothetical protein
MAKRKKNKIEQTFDVYPYLGGNQHFMIGGATPRLHKLAAGDETPHVVDGEAPTYEKPSTYNQWISDYDTSPASPSLLGQVGSAVTKGSDLVNQWGSIFDKNSYKPGGKYSKLGEDGLKFGKLSLTNTRDENALIDIENMNQYLNMNKKDQKNVISSDIWKTPDEMTRGHWDFMNLDEDGNPTFKGLDFEVSKQRSQHYTNPDKGTCSKPEFTDAASCDAGGGQWTGDKLFGIKTRNEDGTFSYRNEDGYLINPHEDGYKGTEYDKIEDKTGPGGLFDANADLLQFDFDKGTCDDGISMTMDACASAGANWIKDDNSLSKVRHYGENEEGVKEESITDYDSDVNFSDWKTKETVKTSKQDRINCQLTPGCEWKVTAEGGNCDCGEEDNEIVGGCGGTRYGCCPDNVTACVDEDCSNCGARYGGQFEYGGQLPKVGDGWTGLLDTLESTYDSTKDVVNTGIKKVATHAATPIIGSTAANAVGLAGSAWGLLKSNLNFNEDLKNNSNINKSNEEIDEDVTSMYTGIYSTGDKGGTFFGSGKKHGGELDRFVYGGNLPKFQGEENSEVDEELTDVEEENTFIEPEGEWATVNVGGQQVKVPFDQRHNYSSVPGQENSNPEQAGFAYQRASNVANQSNDVGIEASYGDTKGQQIWNKGREALNTGVVGGLLDGIVGGAGHEAYCSNEAYADKSACEEAGETWHEATKGTGLVDFAFENLLPMANNIIGQNKQHQSDLSKQGLSSENFASTMESSSSLGQMGTKDINKGGYGDDLYGTGEVFGQLAQQGVETQQPMQQPEKDFTALTAFMNAAMENEGVRFNNEELDDQKLYNGKMKYGGDLPKAQFGYFGSRDGKSNLEQSLKLAGTVGLGSMLTRGLNTGITNRGNYKNAYEDYINNQGTDWYEEMCTEQGCPSWEENRLELLDGHSEPDFSWFRGTDVFGKQNVMNKNNVLQKGDLADAYWQNIKQGAKDGLYTGAINYGLNYLTDRTRLGNRVKNWWQDHNLPNINVSYLSRKYGGEQVLDIDDATLKELIAAGADIEYI